MKKLLILGFIILFSYGLWAEGTLPTGSGTENDPYLITNLDNLLYLSTNDSLWAEDIYFLQTADINAAYTQNWNDGAGFSPIGSYYDNRFHGNYDGNGHTISNLNINRYSQRYIGLFGYIDNAEIVNVVIENCDFSGYRNVGGLVGWNNSSSISNSYTTGIVSGDDYVGGLVGNNFYSSSISNSYATVNVGGHDYVGGLVGTNGSSSISNSYATGSVSGSSFLGGLVGQCSSSSTISTSYSSGSVNGSDIYGYVGGLVGNSSSSSISNSYATGSVSAGSRVGGLVGRSNSSSISNSYASGRVSGDGSVGGLVGENTEYSTIFNSYSIGIVSGSHYSVGGLVGSNNWYSTVTNSFWDTDTSYMESSAGGTGLTTAEMQTLSTFIATGWDFYGENVNGSEDIWFMSGSYPLFLWQVFLTANFLADQAEVTLGDSIQFTDLSDGNPTSWQWDFDNDGTIDSSEENPIWIYPESGVYSVSLTVSNNNYESTETKLDCIQVLPNLPYAEITSGNSLSFGTVSIGDLSDYQTILVQNSGSATLVITEIYIDADNPQFEIDYAMNDSSNTLSNNPQNSPNLSYRSEKQPLSSKFEETLIEVAPDSTLSINVRFAPNTVGSFSQTLNITNNSPNSPILEVSLVGTGQYVPPQSPENIVLIVDEDDAIITWDAVTQNENNEPLAPDYYIVYYNGSNDEAGDFYYHGYTPETSYTHSLVGLYAEFMFYRVKAIKLYTSEVAARNKQSKAEIDRYLDRHLKSGMSEAEVSEVLQALEQYFRDKDLENPAGKSRK